MTVKILVKKSSPDQRTADDFAQRLERNQVEVEVLDADSPSGQYLRELYDLTGHPAIVLVRRDGSMVERWQNSWPLLNEVSYHAHN